MEKEAEERGRALLAENDLLETVPVDPIVLANKAEIEVKNASFKNPEIAGAIMTKGGKTTILVNTVDSYERKRFTIAHELGHYHLHLSGQDDKAVVDMYRSMNGKGSRTEREANSFAAALLMDKIMVTRVWNELHSARALAEIFKVSQEAMGYRLINLGLVK